MSKEVAIRFLTQIVSERDASTQSISLNPEELICKAEEQGIKVTPAELAAAAETILTTLAEAGELRDEELGLVSGGENLTMLQLQSNLSARQRAINMLSSISKSMHDTSMSIIRNLR